MLRVTHGRRLDSLLLRVVDGYVRSHNVVTTALMAGIPKDRLLVKFRLINVTAHLCLYDGRARK